MHKKKEKKRGHKYLWQRQGLHTYIEYIFIHPPIHPLHTHLPIRGVVVVFNIALHIGTSKMVW